MRKDNGEQAGLSVVEDGHERQEGVQEAPSANREGQATITVTFDFATHRTHIRCEGINTLGFAASILEMAKEAALEQERTERERAAVEEMIQQRNAQAQMQGKRLHV